MPARLLQPDKHFFLEINQSKSRFHCLAKARTKNGLGFSGKEDMKTASYAMIGAASK